MMDNEDRQLFEQYEAELDGSAAARRALEHARLEANEREAEWLRHAEQTDSPPPENYRDAPKKPLTRGSRNPADQGDANAEELRERYRALGNSR